jgi:DNA-3-methyladenine glycosylase
MKLLPRSFYDRSVVHVALDLLGRHVRRGPVTVRITEVEAYDEDDSACHARAGRTERNAALWGAPGHAYVYLCYGLHNMFNIVAGPGGRAAAVLVRGVEPVAGLSRIAARRRRPIGPGVLAGPGKVGQALDLDPSWSGHALFSRGGVTVHEGTRPSAILVGPRVGIDFARAADRARPWRFAVADSAAVTHRAELSPLRSSRRARR